MRLKLVAYIGLLFAFVSYSNILFKTISRKCKSFINNFREILFADFSDRINNVTQNIDM